MTGAPCQADGDVSGEQRPRPPLWEQKIARPFIRPIENASNGILGKGLNLAQNFVEKPTFVTKIKKIVV